MIYYVLTKFRIIIILLLFGCASIAPPSGGPKDQSGPEIINIFPTISEDGLISQHQSITFEFNELIDPISVRPSITLNSGIEYKLIIRGRKIIIKPNKIWPENSIIKIQLSRKIKDYQNNMMPNSVNFIASTGKTIPAGKINGTVLNYNPKKLIELGLYHYPITDSSNFIQKIEANHNANFTFDGLENGDYVIGAIEGQINNITEQMQRNKYAILTSDYITIPNEENDIFLLLSDPLPKRKITSIKLLSQYFCKIILDDNSSEYFVIDSLYQPGDSISVQINSKNRLEEYKIPKHTFILPEVIDTIAPTINKSKMINNKLILEFSEPIILKSDAISTIHDSQKVELKFKQQSEQLIAIPNISDTIRNVHLNGESISDWDGNFMKDSSKIINIIEQQNKIKHQEKGGNILGSIFYSGKNSITIKATNTINDSSYFVNSNNKKFLLSDIPSGIYTIWGYESLNKDNQNIYFSGIWAPFKRAAKFSHNIDTIDVRARWDIEGINIKID